MVCKLHTIFFQNKTMNGYKITKQLVAMVHNRQLSWGAFGFGVYVHELWNRAKHQPFEMNMTDISHDTGLSRTTIRGFSAELERVGFIQKTNKKTPCNIAKFTISGCTKIDQPVEQLLTNQPTPVDQSVDQNLTNHTLYVIENKNNLNNSKRGEQMIDEFWTRFLDQPLHWHRFKEANQIDQITLDQKHIEFKNTSISKSTKYARLELVNSHFFNWYMATKKYNKKSGGNYGGKNPAEWMRDNGLI